MGHPGGPRTPDGARLDAPDRCRGAEERADVGGGGSEDSEYPDTEEGARPHIVVDEVLQLFPRRALAVARPDLIDDLENLLHGVLVAEQPHDGEQNEDSWDDREQPAVGERGAPIDQLVTPSLSAVGLNGLIRGLSASFSISRLDLAQLRGALDSCLCSGLTRDRLEVSSIVGRRTRREFISFG